MDPVIWAVLAAVVLFALWRIRATYRSVRSGREKDTRDKLEELRKKRDEQ